MIRADMIVDGAFQARRHITPFKPKTAQDFLGGFALICATRRCNRYGDQTDRVRSDVVHVG